MGVENEMKWRNAHTEDLPAVDYAEEIMVDEMLLTQIHATSFQQMATRPGLRQDKQSESSSVLAVSVHL